MIVRKGQKLGSILVKSGEDEPKSEAPKKKAPAKKAAVKKTEPTSSASSTEKGDEADGTGPPAPSTDGE